MKLLNLRFNPIEERYEVQARWKGFDYEEPTWEPLETMQEDIPEMLENFLKTFHDQELVAKAISS